jgi:hypothetical protein
VSVTTADAGSGIIRLPLETNVCDQVWFVADEAEFAARFGVKA